MKEILDTAQQLGMADHISFNGDLLTISYPPMNVVQLPVRDRASIQGAIRTLHEMHDRMKN